MKDKNTKVNFEQCNRVKELLLEETEEILKYKEKRITLEVGITPRLVRKIYDVVHWSSEKLGGSYNDWTDFSWYKLYSNIKEELNKTTNEKIGEKDKIIARQFSVSTLTVQRFRLGIIELKMEKLSTL